MKWIQEALQSLLDGLQTIFDFVVSLVTGLIDVVKFLPRVFSTLFSSIGQMPSFLTAFAVLTVTILILYIVVGRDNGG